MITERKCRSLIETALSHGRRRADGIEVTINASDVSTSRFANDSMTQNQSPSRVEIAVRVQKNGRQARLASDDISAGGIRRLVDSAISAASFLEPDAQLLPLPARPRQAQRAGQSRYSQRTARLSAAARADAVAAMVAEAKARKVVSSGVVATGSLVTAIGSTTGLFAYHSESSAECSVTMTAPDSSGWAKAHAVDFKDIDPAGLARQAAEKAVASASPQELPPGKYTVILEPPAVLDLISFLWYDFAATSHIDKLSCFLDKLGRQVFGTNITLSDDAYHPLQAGAPFDGEGLPRTRLTLVKNGVLSNLVYGRKAAARLGAQATGHGLPEPNAIGEYPSNLVMAGGDSSLEEMIAGSQRAILLTRVWYVREVDPATKIVTGMTRDGTFLVEDGAIKYGIKNLRFNQSLLEMLNNVEALGPAVRTAGEEGFPAVVPALKVRDFHFASTTSF